MSFEYEIEVFSTPDGKEPFNEWLESIKDKKTKVAILMRIQRLRKGNPGDFKCFDKLIELRLHIGPGYRIYCSKQGESVVLLLGGGDKSSQIRDIKKCKEYLQEYVRRDK